MIIQLFIFFAHNVCKRNVNNVDAISLAGNPAQRIAMLNPFALGFKLLAVNAVRMPVNDFCQFLFLLLDVKRRFGFTVEIFRMRCTSLNVFKKEPIPFNTNGFGESPLKTAMVIGTDFASVNINACAMAGNLNKREL